MNGYEYTFVKYLSHYRMCWSDSSYMKYIEWMGVIAYCSKIGTVNCILHCTN
jgi:hypothetical protein